MTGIIIQARMGSTRLPGKILKDFCGKSLLEHIIFRLAALKKPAHVVIATSNLEQDDVVQNFCEQHLITCFRGDEQNVLKRYYDCALKYGFDNIVRMTGDNPFPDIEELDRLIEFHISNNNDYSECFSVLPIGVGMEIFGFNALKVSMEKSTMPHHFEHVDEYILENTNLFRTGTLSAVSSKNKNDIRLTVDTQEDYDKVCYIIKSSTNEYITTEEAIKICLQYV